MSLLGLRVNGIALTFDLSSGLKKSEILSATSISCIQ